MVPTLICDYCGFSTNKQSTLVAHVVVNHRGKIVVFEGGMSTDAKEVDTKMDTTRTDAIDEPESMDNEAATTDGSDSTADNPVDAGNKMDTADNKEGTTNEVSTNEDTSKESSTNEDTNPKPFGCNDSMDTTDTKKGTANEVSTNEDTNPKPFGCNDCSFSTTTRALMISHVTRVSHATRCHHCPFVSTRREVAAHVNAAHPLATSLVCEDCGFATAKPATLAAHAAVNHRRKLEAEQEAKQLWEGNRGPIMYGCDRYVVCSICLFRTWYTSILGIQNLIHYTTAYHIRTVHIPCILHAVAFYFIVHT